MAIAVTSNYAQNDAVNSTAAVTQTKSYPNAQVAGNTNVVAVKWNEFTTSARTVSVTDTEGNQYIAVGSKVAKTTSGGLQTCGALFVTTGGIKAAGAGANTVTVTWSGTTTNGPTFQVVSIAEYSGVALSSPMYGNGNTAASFSSSPATISLTATSTADWYVVAGPYPDNDDTGTVSGLTQRIAPNDATGDGEAFGDAQATTRNATAVGWAIGSSENCVLVGGVLRAADAAAINTQTSQYGKPLSQTLFGLAKLGSGILVATQNSGSTTVSGAGTANPDIESAVIGAETAASAASSNPTISSAATGAQSIPDDSAAIPTQTVQYGLPLSWTLNGLPRLGQGFLTPDEPTTTQTGTAASTPTITGAGVGAETAASTATSTPTIAGSAVGAETAASTATSTPTINGSAVGAETASAVATSSPTIDGEAVGAETAASTATSTPTINGSGVGAEAAASTATSTPTINGAAAGAETASSTASSAPTINGVGVGAETAASTATSTPTINGAATGVGLGIVDGSLLLTQTSRYGRPLSQTLHGLPVLGSGILQPAAFGTTVTSIATASPTITTSVVGAETAASVATSTPTITGSGVGSETAAAIASSAPTVNGDAVGAETATAVAASAPDIDGAGLGALWTLPGVPELRTQTSQYGRPLSQTLSGLPVLGTGFLQATFAAHGFLGAYIILAAGSPVAATLNPGSPVAPILIPSSPVTVTFGGNSPE